MPETDLYLFDVLHEMHEQARLDDLWSRIYGVGPYASTAEWVRVLIRRDYPDYRG